MNARTVGVLICGIAIWRGAAQTPHSPYVIGSNVQVSSSQPTLRHYEAYGGADPVDSRRLIACAYIVLPDNESDNVFYTSLDGGKTWSHALTKPNSVDPSCEIGRRGTFYAGSIHDQPFPDGQTHSVLNVDRSADGRSWKPSLIQAETRGIDRAYVVVDSWSRKFRGRVYVDGYHASRKPKATILFYPSFDGGATFRRSISVNATTFDQPWFFPGNGVVTRDGAFYALLAELDNTKRNMSYRTDAASAPAAANAVLDVLASRDGGQTLKVIARIPGVFYDWRVPDLSLPELAADETRGPYSGHLYAVWPDARSDRRTQIFFSSSSDGGRHWSPPKIVSDDVSGASENPHANNFMPSIAVNRQGVVGVSWYDRRDNPDNIGYWVRFSASPDGGAHWLTSERISAEPHHATDDPRKNSGDTAGLTADANGVFHLFWIDNRSGVPQMWTASVQVHK